VDSLALESLDLAPHVAQVIGPQLASVDALGKNIVRRLTELLTVIDYTFRNGRLINTITDICTILHTYQHGQINFIDTKAKCCLKIFTCKGTLRQVFICMRPPPLHCIVYVYYILIHTMRGGGERRANQKEG
jgi:hypothetical protein